MLDWLFPETCELCGGASTGSTLCPACRAALKRVPRPICRRCGSPVHGQQTDDRMCEHCAQHKRSYDFARAALAYSDEAMQLIHGLKYHHENHLAPALAPLLDELWENTPELREHDDWVLIPVPVTPARLQERGYNQAEELALALAKLRKLRLLQPLRRLETGVRSQTRLSAAARAKNARRAYRLLPAYASGAKPLSPHLLLLDDVMTTGSTLRACSALLRQAAPKAVIGAVSLMRMGD